MYLIRLFPTVLARLDMAVSSSSHDLFHLSNDFFLPGFGKVSVQGRKGRRFVVGVKRERDYQLIHYGAGRTGPSRGKQTAAFMLTKGP